MNNSARKPRVESEYNLKQGFRYLNRFMLLMWRLGLGQMINIWPEGIGRIMVLTHTGRKTGLKHQTPVNYAIVEGEIYCLAGFGNTSDWYRNLRSNPQVEVWLPAGWWAGQADVVEDPERRVELIRQVLIASAFAGRLAGLNPYTLSDAALGKLTANYKLLHIRRVEARTGAGGPGDLAWIWPIATMLLLPAILRRKRKC
jgi:deazaflavin-dependent oxidoreductase (nitroreductase family)